ncbi:MAG: hypothetical protein K2H43_02185, partial [Clostridia bacterium]|nr:hypothetical protein [Clostridia bacterium]
MNQNRTNQSENKKRIYLIALTAVIFVLTLILSVETLFGFHDINSNAATQTTQGSQIASTELDLGDLLYNYSTSSNDVVFDGNVLDQLYEALTGKKGATYHDVYTAANGGRNATAIANGNAAIYGGAKHIVFRFGTLQWTAAYLFRQGNDVYLDIIEIGDQLGAGTFSTNATNETYNPTNKYPASMYGSSWMRAGALNGGGIVPFESTQAVVIDQDPTSLVAIYTMANGSYTYRPVTLNLTETNIGSSSQIVFGVSTTNTVTGSLVDYIATPSQISYQATESSLVGAYWAGSAKYYRPSDCYGTSTPIAGASWHSRYDFRNNINNTTPAGDPGAGVDVYNIWKDDKLWCPSITEVHDIWDLTYAQLQTSAATAFWSRNPRCAYGTATGSLVRVTGAGGTDGWCTAARYLSGAGGGSYRPALHLNLTKAAKNAAYTAPSGSFTATYNGEAQTAVTLQTGLLSTYSGGYSPTLSDKDSATDLGFQIAYYKGKRGDANGGGAANGSGNLVTSMTDAGDYEVAVKFPASGSLKWKSTATDSSKGEDAETRVYDFKIKQKSVTLTMTVTNKGVVTITAPAGSVYTRDGTVSASGFDLEYDVDTGNLAGGKAESWYIDHPDKTKPPEYAGKYKVTLKALGKDSGGTGNSPTNFNPDKYNYNNNYAFSTIPQTKTFTYPKTEVAEPTVSGGTSAMTVSYDGTEQTFTIVYDSERITLT